MREGLSTARRIMLSAAITALVMWGLLYAPTPYLVFEPGIAVPVEPMISLPSGSSADEGQFLLTAVKLIEPNLLGVLRASADRDRDVYTKNAVFGSYSKQQYSERLTIIMEGSQNDAVEAAYRYLNIPYKVQTKSIVISDVIMISNQPVGRLKAGDRLQGLRGGEAFSSVQDAAQKVLSVVQRPNKDGLVLEVERHGKMMDIPIEPLSKGNGQDDASQSTKRLADMLGVRAFTELRVVEATEKAQRLAIAAGEIGGPSAGLVFTLGAIDLLTEGELTGGARIAATGTISPEGKVGAIGGVKQKVVTTSKEGAELFLVPKSNEKEAAAKAKSIGTNMKVVGVGTLQEAMDAIASYLKER